MPRNIDAENNYRKALESLRILAIRDLVSWWKKTEVLGFTKQKSLMLEPFQAVVATYGEQAAYAAAEYLFLSRSLADHLAGLEYPEVADPVGFEQAKGSFEWAMNTSRDATGEFDKQLALRKLAGITNRLVAQPARQTVMQAVEKAGTAYARIPEPGACSFCLMLASRGAVYSKDTVLFKKTGGKYHDNCRCVGIEVQTPEDLPQINKDLEAIWKKSADYPGDDRKAFQEAVTRHRNGTPAWVPADAKRYSRTVGADAVKKVARRITIEEAEEIGLIGGVWLPAEAEIRDWLLDNGAQSVVAVAELDKLPDGRGEKFSARTGIRKTPDVIVDGITAEMKTVISKTGLKNRARKGKFQSANLIYDMRSVSLEEAEIYDGLRQVIRDNGVDLDRIVVILPEGSILWERS